MSNNAAVAQELVIRGHTSLTRFAQLLGVSYQTASTVAEREGIELRRIGQRRRILYADVLSYLHRNHIFRPDVIGPEAYDIMKDNQPENTHA